MPRYKSLNVTHSLFHVNIIPIGGTSIHFNSSSEIKAHSQIKSTYVILITWMNAKTKRNLLVTPNNHLHWEHVLNKEGVSMSKVNGIPQVSLHTLMVKVTQEMQ